ncbi:DUF1367 family protein [Erwinia amylovora]|uniref:DUF1367 family protein n=1 Tax=Erwinia amylovora TaxID=552 RepID=UPI001443E441|nr:DUF1367 family protein [Erwinia amylovora]
MAQLQLQKIGPAILTPATPEASDFLQRIELVEWIDADFKRVRHFPFHTRFFKLLQPGFEYWDPTGGAILPEERKLVNGWPDFLCRQVGQQHSVALAAEQYLADAAYTPTADIALLKSVNAYREWVNVQAGYYTEHLYPDGSRHRRAKSVSLTKMDEIEFQRFCKSTQNVLWNWIFLRQFSSPAEVENVAAQILEYAA